MNTMPFVVIDTREKEPYSFSCQSIHKKLNAGDYSIEGFENRIAIERKSLDDFVNTIIHARDRFHRELCQLSTYESAGIVVEGTLRDIIAARYRSKVHPNAVIGSTLSIMVDYGIPVYFCCDRQAACFFTEQFLKRIHRRLTQCHITTPSSPLRSEGR
jgi:ERCC4-type nuclease